MEIDTVVFDLGGVLIDWNPEYVFLDAFKGDSEKTQWFLNHVCTMDWNENQDAGYPIAKATADLIQKFPQYKTYIAMYYGEWENMLGGAIQGTVNILESVLKNKTYKVYALTNWSAETFPIAKQRFEFLNWFHGIVVSGEEGTRKPHNAIFDKLCHRYNIVPERAVFIDDNLRNVEAAIKLGFNAIQYLNPEQLKMALKTCHININD